MRAMSLSQPGGVDGGQRRGTRGALMALVKGSHAVQTVLPWQRRSVSRSFMVPEPSFFLLVGQEEQLPGPKPIHLSPRKVNP